MKAQKNRAIQQKRQPYPAKYAYLLGDDELPCLLQLGKQAHESSSTNLISRRKHLFLSGFLNRRRFIKYAGTAAAIVGASAVQGEALGKHVLRLPRLTLDGRR